MKSMLKSEGAEKGSPRRRRVPQCLLAGAVAIAFGGCDLSSLVELEQPDLITLPVVRDTANLPMLRNGVLFEFARAYAGSASNASGADYGQVLISGLLADELWYSSTFTTHKEIDARRTEPTNGSALISFRYLHRARNLAELADELYALSPRANTADHALVTNLAGFTYLMFGENYCSGVPFSQQPLSGETVYGPPQTTEQILNLAIERFDRALAIAGVANSAVQSNLARVGTARALLNLGRFAEAAEIASQVPTTFNYQVEYGEATTSQNNAVFFFNSQARRISPASREGTNGHRFFNRGSTGVTLDPRVRVDSLGVGSGTRVPLYQQLNYAARGANLPLATGVEASLIQAEHLLNAGESAAYLPVLNQLRAGIGLPPLIDPITPAARVDQLFSERAFWLWLTAHRLGDLRRLIRQYGRSADQVFPTGVTIFGEAYGTDVNLPIPVDEANNPNFDGGCIHREA